MKHLKFLLRNSLLAGLSITLAILSLGFAASLVGFALSPLLVGLAARGILGQWGAGSRPAAGLVWVLVAAIVLLFPGGGDFAHQIVFKAFFVPLCVAGHFVGGYLSRKV